MMAYEVKRGEKIPDEKRLEILTTASRAPRGRLWPLTSSQHWTAARAWSLWCKSRTALLTPPYPQPAFILPCPNPSVLLAHLNTTLSSHCSMECKAASLTHARLSVALPVEDVVAVVRAAARTHSLNALWYLNTSPLALTTAWGR